MSMIYGFPKGHFINPFSGKRPRTGRGTGTYIRGAKKRKTNTRSGGVENIELKSRTGTGLIVNLNNGGQIIHIGGIAQGTDIDERIGRTIVTKKIYMHLTVSQQATTVKQFYRFFILYDRQPNGSIATMDSILDLSSFSALNFKEIDSRERYKTLWDSGLVFISMKYNHIRF